MRHRYKSGEREAGAIRAGSRARDDDVARDRCPYPDGGRANYWREGWDIRNGAIARWALQADDVEGTLARAATFLDRAAPPGKVPPSKLIGLHFYAYGSAEPDKAYDWFQATMRLARHRYREERRANASPPPSTVCEAPR